MDKFTVEEINFMCVFENESRVEMIQSMKAIMPHISDSDMEELGQKILDKLEKMTDQEFAEIVLEPADDEDTESENLF